MNLEWLTHIGLLEVRPDTRVLQHYPLTVRRAVVEHVVNYFHGQYGAACEGLTDIWHMKWTLECTGAAFELPLPQCDETVSKAIDIYKVWLKGPSRRPAVMQSHFAFVMSELIRHLSLIFKKRTQPSSTSPSKQDVHTKLCVEVLELYASLGHNTYLVTSLIEGNRLKVSGPSEGPLQERELADGARHTAEDFPVGSVVEAVNLQQLTSLNNKKGRVMGHVEGRVLVDFPSRGQFALQCDNVHADDHGLGPEIWDVLITVLLGITDFTVVTPHGLPELRYRLISVLFECLLRSPFVSEELWATASRLFSTWIQCLPAVRQWSACLKALTIAIHPFIQSPDLAAPSNLGISPRYDGSSPVFPEKNGRPPGSGFVSTSAGAASGPADGSPSLRPLTQPSSSKDEGSSRGDLLPPCSPQTPGCAKADIPSGFPFPSASHHPDFSMSPGGRPAASPVSHGPATQLPPVIPRINLNTTIASLQARPTSPRLTLPGPGEAPELDNSNAKYTVVTVAWEAIPKGFRRFTEVRLEERKALSTWQRIFYLIKDPNAITDPRVYAEALDGVRSTCLLLARGGWWKGSAKFSGTVAGFAGKDAGSRMVKEARVHRAEVLPRPSPSVASVYALAGDWLLEAVFRPDPARRSEARATAVAALCDVTLRPWRKGSELSHVKQFYAALKTALNLASESVDCEEALAFRTSVLASAELLFTLNLPASYALLPSVSAVLAKVLKYPSARAARARASTAGFHPNYVEDDESDADTVDDELGHTGTSSLLSPQYGYTNSGNLQTSHPAGVNQPPSSKGDDRDAGFVVLPSSSRDARMAERRDSVSVPAQPSTTNGSSGATGTTRFSPAQSLQPVYSNAQGSPPGVEVASPQWAAPSSSSAVAAFEKGSGRAAAAASPAGTSLHMSQSVQSALSITSPLSPRDQDGSPIAARPHAQAFADDASNSSTVQMALGVGLSGNLNGNPQPAATDDSTTTLPKLSSVLQQQARVREGSVLEHPEPRIRAHALTLMGGIVAYASRSPLQKQVQLEVRRLLIRALACETDPRNLAVILQIAVLWVHVEISGIDASALPTTGDQLPSSLDEADALDPNCTNPETMIATVRHMLEEAIHLLEDPASLTTSAAPYLNAPKPGVYSTASIEVYYAAIRFVTNAILPYCATITHHSLPPAHQRLLVRLYPSIVGRVISALVDFLLQLDGPEGKRFSSSEVAKLSKLVLNSLTEWLVACPSHATSPETLKRVMHAVEIAVSFASPESIPLPSQALQVFYTCLCTPYFPSMARPDAIVGSVEEANFRHTGSVRWFILDGARILSVISHKEVKDETAEEERKKSAEKVEIHPGGVTMILRDSFGRHVWGARLQLGRIDGEMTQARTNVMLQRRHGISVGPERFAVSPVDCMQTLESLIEPALPPPPQPPPETPKPASKSPHKAMRAFPARPPAPPPSTPELGRLLLAHLQLLSSTSSRLVELKNTEALQSAIAMIDNTPIRETHRFNVLYLHDEEGTEELQELGVEWYIGEAPSSPASGKLRSSLPTLSDFTSFVAGLGWPIDPADNPQAYTGGAPGEKWRRQRVHYHASAHWEAVWAVSAVTPSGLRRSEREADAEKSEDKTPVRIVWNDTAREYNPSATSNDAVVQELMRQLPPWAPRNSKTLDIVIQPLEDKLCSLRIILPLGNERWLGILPSSTFSPAIWHAPLCDGMVIPLSCLPDMIRSACITANQAFRTHWQSAYDVAAQQKRQAGQEVPPKHSFNYVPPVLTRGLLIHRWCTKLETLSGIPAEYFGEDKYSEGQRVSAVRTIELKSGKKLLIGEKGVIRRVASGPEEAADFGKVGRVEVLFDSGILCEARPQVDIRLSPSASFPHAEWRAKTQCVADDFISIINEQPHRFPSSSPE